jgi:cbb3-type cytochrome oxidase subunit 3
LFTSKSRTWLLTVILAIITLVFSIISIGNIVNITTLIISGVILYYMYRPQVKSYFGRVTTPK